MLKFFAGFLTSCLVIVLSCSREPQLDTFGEKAALQYAKGFEIHTFNGYKRVDVLNPFQGASNKLSYYLVHKGNEVPDGIKNETIIRTPLESVVCTSTTHIPLLEYIGVGDALKGFPHTDYISSSSMRKRIDADLVTELGREQGINLELLLSVSPEVVIGYLMSADMGQLGKIQEMKIPVIINAEYLEPHPLGRAEWIKFIGAFFERSEIADSVFNGISSRYEELVLLANGFNERPSVISGVVYGDTWFMPGGNNYAAKIIADAGGEYLWKSDTTAGFIELSFEKVFEKGGHADVWVGTSSFNSFQEMESSESRYAMFGAFKNGELYNYNKRIGEMGGNEYLELGYLRPDFILNDLMTIFHPGFSNQELFFFQRLK